ncbi:MAG: ATP-binding cassette domain-containing protein [Candidatus Coatesbacteria bacterium]|mgnify:FL=1
MLQYLHVSGPQGRVWVLRAFNLEIKPGELVHVTGPSGAGKSLLVRMALGSVAPASGTVLVNGQNPYKSSGAGRQGLRRVVSAVLDDEPVLNLTAEAWVALGLSCGGRPWPAAVTEARAAIERAGLGAHAGAPFAVLSRGVRYALALVRGLARKPHVLLVDWAVDDGDAVPGPLRAEFAAYLAGSGACLVTGAPGLNAVPAGGRVESLAAPAEDA